MRECNDSVALMPGHEFDFYPLDLYRRDDFSEVVPHYAILD